MNVNFVKNNFTGELTSELCEVKDYDFNETLRSERNKYTYAKNLYSSFSC